MKPYDFQIGIDLGGTKIEALALTPDGGVPVRRPVATPTGYSATLGAISTLVSEIEQQLGGRGSVGVGIPGVISAMPMFKALAACPDAVVIRPDFTKYVAASRQIRGLMAKLTPLVQPLSIDEAVLDLTGGKAFSILPQADVTFLPQRYGIAIFLNELW